MKQNLCPVAENQREYRHLETQIVNWFGHSGDVHAGRYQVKRYDYARYHAFAAVKAKERFWLTTALGV